MMNKTFESDSAEVKKPTSAGLTGLKRAKCHKIVDFCPMSRGAYNAFKGWEIPSDESPEDDGYLIVYDIKTDGEYISWSPKKKFDDGYTEIG